MDFYTCPTCKNQVKNIHRESHELYCQNSIREEEYMNLIPCEICGNNIQFDEFMQHMETCGRQPPMPRSLQDFLNEFPPISTIPLNINPNNQTNQSLGNEPNNESNNEPNNEPNNESNNELNNETNNEPNNHNTNILNVENLQEHINQLIQNITDINGLNLGDMPNFTITPINNLESGEDEYSHFTNLINDIGNVNIGVDINKVTTVEVNETDCPICGDKFDIVRRTHCKHDFCYNCLEEWLRENKNCPICSTELNEI